jgi:hypothetical protein
MRAAAVAILLVACSAAEAHAPPSPTLETVTRKIRYSLPPPPADDLTHDVAIEDASGHALDRFAESLVRAARHEGVARMVFYGGSHTASDLYTGEIRTRLQHRFGDAGHGFVLAAQPITQYWQSGVRVEDGEGWDTVLPDLKHFGVDSYGIAGIAFDANVSAWAAASTDDSTASHLSVMYLRQPGGGSFDVTIDGAPIETIDTASDTVLTGLHDYAVADGEHRIEIEASGHPHVRVYGFVFERETDHGVVVDQMGLAGSKARHQLFWDREVWRSLLGTRRPDLIALSYGNNEGDDTHLTAEQHISQFDQMLARVREDFPRASCLVIGPSDRQVPDPVTGALATPALIGVLNEAQRTAARDHGCAFFDTIAWQGGPGAVDRWIAADPPLERDDRVHWTELAYRRFGVALLRTLANAMARPGA